MHQTAGWGLGADRNERARIGCGANPGSRGMLFLLLLHRGGGASKEHRFRYSQSLCNISARCSLSSLAKLPPQSCQNRRNGPCDQPRRDIVEWLTL
jgi:hypothetical protein